MNSVTPAPDRRVLETPDGRYIVVRGRLWRRARPDLPADVRDRLVHGLMDARRAVKAGRKGDDAAAAKVYEGTAPLTARDIAATAFWIATLPPHININSIEMMPTCQGPGPLAIKRTAPAA